MNEVSSMPAWYAVLLATDRGTLMHADPLNLLAQRKRGGEPEQAQTGGPPESDAAPLQLAAGIVAKLAALGVMVYIRAHYSLPRLLEEALQSERGCLAPCRLV